MSSCEKCWSNAYTPWGNQADEYTKLIEEHTCTPEQQAGRDAIKCPKCDRWTIHQYTLEPMCGCVLASQSDAEAKRGQ